MRASCPERWADKQTAWLVDDLVVWIDGIAEPFDSFKAAVATAHVLTERISDPQQPSSECRLPDLCAHQSSHV